MTRKEVQDRIRDLYPGDTHKVLRNRLYSIIGFLDSSPTDQMIRNEAEGVADIPEPHDLPKKEKKAAPEVKTGEIMTPEAEAKLAKEQASALASVTKPVIVVTAADYQEADKGFSAIKKMLKDNEERRKKLKAPILEAGRVIDAEFKSAETILTAELSRYETPMLAFKRRECEELRKQEEERQKAVQEAQARLQAEADAARIKLDEAMALEKQLKADAAADPFLSALDDYDVEDAHEAVLEAYAETRNAMVEVALAPQRMASLMPEAVAPVTAAGSRVFYPWVIKVTDETLVERKFCTPDSVKLNALAKLLKATVGDISKINPQDFPGLSITEDIRLGGR